MYKHDFSSTSLLLNKKACLRHSVLIVQRQFASITSNRHIILLQVKKQAHVTSVPILVEHLALLVFLGQKVNKESKVKDSIIDKQEGGFIYKKRQTSQLTVYFN